MSAIDIDAILELSCLAITDERKEEFGQQLTTILEYMDVLKGVTANASDEFQWPLSKEVVLREDVPLDFSHKCIEKNAPDFAKHCFRVPKILS